MRFARLGEPDHETPVVADRAGTWRDLRSVTDDLTPHFLTEQLPALLVGGDVESLPVYAGPTRPGKALVGIGKIVCVGLNYRDHAAETNAELPPEPILFLKAPDTVVGAEDEVLIPRRSVKTDYEVELAVVIGRTARYLDSEAAALDHVAGYAISNDVSEREFQTERGGQWDKGKNCETFNPFGPWLVSADEVPDPQALGMRLWVNGELRQNGTTSDMAFGVAHLVHYISQFMTLHPGDVINTGTPAGVAMGRPDGVYLSKGDVVELEIDRLGRQRQQFGQA